MKLFKVMISLLLLVSLTFGMVFAQDLDQGFEVGDLSEESTADKSGIAVDFLSKKSSNGDFKVKKIYSDDLGLTTVKLEQQYNNTPIWGADLNVNIDEKGVVKSVIGNVLDIKGKLITTPGYGVSKQEAIDIAMKDLGIEPELLEEAMPEIVIYNSDTVPCYVYKFEFVYDSPTPGRWIYFVNANTGSVMNKINLILTAQTEVGTGEDVLGNTRSFNTTQSGNQYYLIDSTRGNGIVTYDARSRYWLPGSYWTDADNLYYESYDKPAVSSQYYLGVTYDYFMSKFGRNSFDNNGAKIISSVHVGRSYNNAYWNGRQFAFGDGDGYVFYPLSGSLDVVAHEFTHAVTEHTANLIYQNESGALNEAISDIFGAAVEFHLNENPDWLLGEDITGPGLGRPSLRSLADPTSCGDPDHYSNIYTGTADNGGVHTNSGVINKVAYLIGNGGTHYGVTVQGQGVAVMEDVFYRALTVYMTPSTNFSQARLACIQAATDLYGANSSQVQAVQNAFTACGIQ